MKLYSLMMWTLLLRTFQPPQWHVLDWIQWMRTRSYWTRSAVWQAATGHSTAHHNTETAKQHCSVTCAEMEMSQDPAVAATVCEHLVRLKSLISALNNKPARGEIQHKREPGNKKETKRKPECWCCKRHCHRRNTPQTWPEAEGLFPCTKRRANQRLASLSNQTEVVSQGTAGTDHDYHVMLLQMKYCALHSVVDFAAIYTVYLFTSYASPLILFSSLFPYLSFPFKIDSLHFQARGHKRRPNPGFFSNNHSSAKKWKQQNWTEQLMQNMLLI